MLAVCFHPTLPARTWRWKMFRDTIWLPWARVVSSTIATRTTSHLSRRNTPMVISKIYKPLINTKYSQVTSTTIPTFKICKGNLATTPSSKIELLTATTAKAATAVVMLAEVRWTRVINTVTKMAWRCRASLVQTNLSAQYTTNGISKLLAISVNRVVVFFQAWPRVAEDSVRRFWRSLATLNWMTQSSILTANKTMMSPLVLEPTTRCKVTGLRCMIRGCPFQVLKTFELTDNFKAALLLLLSTILNSNSNKKFKKWSNKLQTFYYLGANCSQGHPDTKFTLLKTSKVLQY